MTNLSIFRIKTTYRWVALAITMAGLGLAGNASAATLNNTINPTDKLVNLGVDNTVIGTNTNSFGQDNSIIGVRYLNVVGAANKTANTNGASNTNIIGRGNTVSGRYQNILGSFNEVVVPPTNSATSPAAYDSIGSLGDKNQFSASNTYVVGSRVAADVENSVYLGSMSSVTDGNGTDTSYQNKEVVLNPTAAATATLGTTISTGTTTTAGAHGTVTQATVNGVTYSGFAGETAVGAVSVGASGTERRIQNVAAGEISETSTDAINGSQLYAVAAVVSNNLQTQIQGASQQLGDLNIRVNNLTNQLRDADAGIAGAMAQGAIPQVTRAGAAGIGVGTGYYGGESAVAVGFSGMSDEGNWIYKGNVSMNTRGKTGVGLGALYQW